MGSVHGFIHGPVNGVIYRLYERGRGRERNSADDAMREGGKARRGMYTIHNTI